MIAKKTLMILTAGFITTGAVHAEDRDDNEKLGSTSSDTTLISLGVKGGDGINKPGTDGSILIQNLKPITFSDFGAAGGGDLTESSTFCVYRTGGGSGAISYNLTPSSSNSALKNGENSISYSMSYGDNSSSSNDVDLGFNILQKVNTSANGTLSESEGAYTCTGENGLLTITATFEDVAAAPAGTYQDTLTLLVEPN